MFLPALESGGWTIGFWLRCGSHITRALTGGGKCVLTFKHAVTALRKKLMKLCGKGHMLRWTSLTLECLYTVICAHAPLIGRGKVVHFGHVKEENS